MKNKKSVLIYCSLLFVTTSCLSMSFSRFSLKQSINVPALKMITSIVRKPNLAIPQQELKCLSELNVQTLKGAGIKYVVFDKDNTLCYTYSDALHPSVVNKVNECKRAFSPSSVAILSNSVGTKDDTNYAGAVATELAMSIPVIRHDNKKPGCLNEVISHFQACTLSGTDVQPHEICVIGDRLLTDIVFANQYGMYSVLVQPLNQYRDHPVAVVIRFIELMFILPLLKLFGFRRELR